MQTGNKVFIKGMVCQRCIAVVKTQLETAGFVLDAVNLGEVTLSANTSLRDTSLIEQRLSPLGFSILRDKKTSLVKEVKEIVKEIYNGEFDFPARFRFSELVTRRLGKDYDTISAVFSMIENTTIEKYIIGYRIEKIKELLVYTNDTLADISFRLGFSSIAHLSRQFKQQTGMTPTYFKQLNSKRNT